MKRKKRISKIVTRAKEFAANEERKWWKKFHKKSLRRWKFRNYVLRFFNGRKQKRLDRTIKSWEEKNHIFDETIIRLSRKEKLLDESLMELIKITARIKRIETDIKTEAEKVEKHFKTERSSILRLIR